ncbi:ABC transporter permease [Patulibacter minatonensis]|uniref:ABC transporter permease n=1 Tax=Patulibacter minatonensis TaxID=298163 RepID=UPI0004B3A00D|nr:ABC transporter permease [Patulibacter minatonensis]
MSAPETTAEGFHVKPVARDFDAIDRSTLKPPIKGPSALGTDFRRMIGLAWTMATAEFKLRFYGSVLGYFWQLARPMLLFGVLMVVFTVVVRLGNDVELYGPTLLLGIVLFTFLGDATGGAVSAMVDRENLVRKIDFPRMAVPVSVVILASFNLVLNLIPVLIFLLASGAEIRWTWLELPFLLLLLGVLCLAIAMILSALYVRFRDVRPIWEVVLQAMFYASGVLVPVQAIQAQFGDRIEQILMMNPFSAILQQARHAMIAPSHPSALACAHHWYVLLIPTAITLALLIGGFVYFNREAPRIAERL